MGGRQDRQDEVSAAPQQDTLGHLPARHVQGLGQLLRREGRGVRQDLEAHLLFSQEFGDAHDNLGLARAHPDGIGRSEG